MEPCLQKSRIIRLVKRFKGYGDTAVKVMGAIHVMLAVESTDLLWMKCHFTVTPAALQQLQMRSFKFRIHVKHDENIISLLLFTNNGTTQNVELNSKGRQDDPCFTDNAY